MCPQVLRIKCGFTLMELMIAILLLTGGIAAATFMMGRGMYATTDSETMEQAVALAQEKMEAIRGTAFASIASEAKAAVLDFSGFSREVIVTLLETDLKQVVVTVYWDTPEGEISSSLITYVANVA